MAPRFHKHKILLDENFPPRLKYPRLNGMFDAKHLRDDLGGGGITDDQVYDLASKLRRIVVTFNAKDFKKLTSKSNTTGVIGVISPISWRIFIINLAHDRLERHVKAFFEKNFSRVTWR